MTWTMKTIIPAEPIAGTIVQDLTGELYKRDRHDEKIHAFAPCWRKLDDRYDPPRTPEGAL